MKRLVSSVIFGLVTINTLVQAETTRPKLVVGIVVDQLRTDYLEYLNTLFGQKGFNRLMNNGVYLKNVDFRETVSDPATATAVIYTGSWPAFNGLGSDMVFDEATRRSVPALQDKTVKGTHTADQLSPASLILSTISDELAIDGSGLGKIYSISSDGQQAIVMASHAGNGAVWIDDNNGQWASSSYYNEFPQPVAGLNRSASLSSRMSGMQWKPSMNLAVYPGIPEMKKQFDFNYTFPTSDRNAYRKFKSSPLSNVEVTDAAIASLKGLNLGRRGEAIDMLNVAYTAAPYKYAGDKDYRLELEDSYIRLDAQIARLLEEIDAGVGLENTFIFLSSTGYYDDAAKDDDKFRIPSGEFYLKRAESLLNSYLSAIHGNGDYVGKISGSKIYLDHKTIESKGLSISKVREEAREFLGKMSGIAAVYIVEDIRQNTGNRQLADLALSIDPKTAADIYMDFTPGWTVVDDYEYPEQRKVARKVSPLTPAFILYPPLKPQEVDERVEATVIAPTITSNLHIRAPNGASEKPLTLKTR